MPNYHNTFHRYNSKKIEKLYDSDSFKNLRWLHTETAKLQHGIKTYSEGWKTYNPTLFMYAFYFFNTLYSINWEESIKRGKIWHHDDDTHERDKFNCLIEFCIKDDEDFSNIFKDKFVEIISAELTRSQIFSIINTIKPDKGYLGRVTKTKISNFKKSIESLFDRKLENDIVQEIIGFVYLIRNNIFHGTKTLEQMGEGEHQAKLLLYSYFIIAVNQMLFSYMDYLYEKTVKATANSCYDDLIYILKSKQKTTENIETLDNDVYDSDFGDL